MPDFENVLYDKYGADNRIARITLNRPEKMNSLSQELLRDFRAALEEAEDDPEVRVVVVKGAGRTFSAGYDITPGRRPPAPSAPGVQGQTGQDRRSVSTIRTGMVRVTDFQLFLFNYAKPTIA